MAGRVGQPRAAGLAGRPGRRRHGRLGHRRPAGAGRARRPRLAADRGQRATTGCRPGRRPTRPSCAPATRATPRRRWPPTRPPGRSGHGGSSATTGGALARSARADGVPVIPLPGGFQPRAAVGYGLVVALEVAALAGVRRAACTPRSTSPPPTLRSSWRQWGPDSPEDSLAKTIARSLHGTVPQIAGAGLTTPIAYRWKTQINENASAPAFAAELPELDHNEIVGWEGAAGLGRFSAVFLDDCDLHPRVRSPDRAHPRGDRRCRPRRPTGSRRVGETPGRAAGVDGAAGRSGLDVHGRAGRARPGRRSRRSRSSRPLLAEQTA